MYNCAAYENDNDGFSYGAGWSAGATQTFKNCWAWNNNKAASGADWVYDGNNSANIANNVWMSVYGGVNYGNLSSTISISSADFLSVSSAGVAGIRQSDGSFPVLNFLKLASTSKLINKGVNVGLPYTSTAPDLGAFESGLIITPVKLTDLTATAQLSKTLLKWATATEINSSVFEVDRSIDGINFEKIGSVNAGGNTNAPVSYQFTDYLPVNGINYYRLKMVDKDGQFEYSKIVSTTFRITDQQSVKVISAQINNQALQLNLSSTKQQSAIIGLYDATGRTIFTSNITLQKGTNNINKPVMIANGIYYFKLTTTDQAITLSLLNGK